MSRLFFDELGIPKPDVNLEVGSASHAVQTAEVMKRFEPVCIEHDPDWIIVVGDVNSTLACALVACKLGIGVAHVEAGLRSFDRDMPEEINRVLTDAIADHLFVSEPTGVTNLKREGVDPDKIHFVGNVMIDSLLRCRSKADERTIISNLKLQPKRYALVTLHRPSNVDNLDALVPILDALETIGRDMPVVFPIHPRSRKMINHLGLEQRINGMAALRLIEPLGYLDFLRLMSQASVVLTDSGGIQEETTILGVPCLTLRRNTERPITISQGTNRLAGASAEAILLAYHDAINDARKSITLPELWDGHAAERIVSLLIESS
jgi:UDP-N-acetylglucosamine 2-epimerase (non-hydrolysing)